MISFSLESPFRKILHNALKDEEEDYDCPILSNNCPFSNKQFIKRIKLGQKEPKEFMDEMMDTVISDLKQPLENKNHEFYVITFNQLYNLLSCITGIFIVINMIFVINYALGIGESISILYCTRSHKIEKK